jgi:hypothetical protein
MKASKKEKCWADYKAQLLYIDAMREAKEDPEFDPRRTHLIVGKDGRYEKISQSAIVVPKNPLTVQYLCHAYDVPYPTFKEVESRCLPNQDQCASTYGGNCSYLPEVGSASV